jgi:hypothetical protein
MITHHLVTSVLKITDAEDQSPLCMTNIKLINSTLELNVV